MISDQIKIKMIELLFESLKISITIQCILINLNMKNLNFKKKITITKNKIEKILIDKWHMYGQVITIYI